MQLELVSQLRLNMSTYDERYYNACRDSMSNASYSNTTQGDGAMIIYEPKNKY